MKNFVLCIAGVVVQSDRTVQPDDKGVYTPPENFIEAPDFVTPGYHFDGHTFYIPRVTLDECYAKLAARRWQAQTSGMMFNGIPIKTDQASTATLTSAYVQAKADPSYVVSNWKVGTNTFVTLDAATIIAIGDAVTAFVQSCFDNESVLSHALATNPDYETVDLEQGWP